MLTGNSENDVFMEANVVRVSCVWVRYKKHKI